MFIPFLTQKVKKGTMIKKSISLKQTSSKIRGMVGKYEEMDWFEICFHFQSKSPYNKLSGELTEIKEGIDIIKQSNLRMPCIIFGLVYALCTSEPEMTMSPVVDVEPEFIVVYLL